MLYRVLGGAGGGGREENLRDVVSCTRRCGWGGGERGEHLAVMLYRGFDGCMSGGETTDLGRVCYDGRAGREWKKLAARSCADFQTARRWTVRVGNKVATRRPPPRGPWSTNRAPRHHHQMDECGGVCGSYYRLCRQQPFGQPLPVQADISILWRWRVGLNQATSASSSGRALSVLCTGGIRPRCGSRDRPVVAPLVEFPQLQEVPRSAPCCHAHDRDRPSETWSTTPRRRVRASAEYPARDLGARAARHWS
jgi:hypothetical protein